MARNKEPSLPRFRLLMAGLGNMGNHWLRVLSAVDDVELVAAVEIDSELARERFEQYHLEPKLHFTSYEDALRETRPDGVLLVTPPAEHRWMSIASMEVGIPVLSEKPLAESMESGQEILAAAERTGVLHMVSQDYRYRPPVQTVKRVLDSGDLGAVGSVTVGFFKSLIRSGFHDTLAYPLTIDMSIHHFDLMRFFLGREPRSIYGRAWRTPWDWWKGDSSTSVLLEFAGGVQVTYAGSWCATGRETTWIGDWRFECEHGVVIMQDDRVTVQRRTTETGLPQGYPQYLNEKPKRVPLVKMPVERQGMTLSQFCRAVRTGELPPTTVRDNINSFRMVWDTIRSFETGQTVPVEDSP
ncbi:MAG: Gfo/Idh/MocA family oxidoreductase [Caldilineae bacterium]|nr:Gfo/Idh/MocA family oxidoreductase [Caldilineae bacterium]